MLHYRDFIPQRVVQQTRKLFGTDTETHYETFKDAVQAANEWLVASDVTLVNVETVVLPNIWEEHEEGSDDGSLYTGGTMSHWHQFVRVWYQDEA